MTPTKPPPQPPKFAGAAKLLSPKVFDGPVQQLTHYAMPLRVDSACPAWVDMLLKCGKPTDVVVIDFETYFDEEYKMMRGSGEGLTTIEYVMDPRFEVISCAFTMMKSDSPPDSYRDNTVVQVTEEMVATQIGALQRKYGDDLSGCTIVFQNARFDALILSRRYGIHPPHVVDLLDLLRHWNSREKHGLGDQAEKHHLPAKGDTGQFKGVTLRKRYVVPKGRKKGPKLPVQRPLMTAEQRTALIEYNSGDNYREWELFTIMLPRLSNPTVELRLMQHTLELWTKPTLRCDFAKGEEIIIAMDAEIDKALAPLKILEYSGDEALGYVKRTVTREEISGNKTYEALLTDALRKAGDNPMEYMKMVKTKDGHEQQWKFADAKDDNFRSDLIAHRDERVRQIMHARISIKSWPLHMSRVRRIMAIARADKGRLPVPLKYCGAHTGRWSGGEKINLQNLGSRGHELVSMIRSMIVAPDGQTLVLVDAAQIEARGTDWIAGEDESCARWAAGEDQYAAFASTVMGFKVREATANDPPPVAKRMKRLRDAIGKTGVLGCQYGMGASKAQDYAYTLTGITITFEEAEKLVDTYRKTHTKVTQFWKDIEKAFIYTAKYKRSCALPRGIRFDSTVDCDVVMTLPNGREIKYAKVKIEPDRWSDKAKVWNGMEHKWEYIWGGTLTENLVQAFSRDCLAEAFLRVEDRGYHTAMHCHDEMIAPVPDEIAEQVLAIAIEEMSRRPVWAPDFPLGAEGQISKVYKK